MTAKKKLLLGLLAAALLIASFFCGQYAERRENERARRNRCDSLITLALQKAEEEDLTDPAVAEALISNVYAAYVLCDDPVVSARLHDLWNVLLFDRDAFIGQKDALVRELAGSYQVKK